jgi:hypothetical protein
MQDLLSVVSMLQSAYRHLDPPGLGGSSSAVLTDGTIFMSDENGRLVYAQYPSGVSVRRFNDYAVTLANDGNYYVTHKTGLCSRLD